MACFPRMFPVSFKMKRYIWVSLDGRPVLCTFKAVFWIHTVLEWHPLWSMLPPELSHMIRKLSLSPLKGIKLCRSRHCTCFYLIKEWKPLKYIDMMIKGKIRAIRSNVELDRNAIEHVLKWAGIHTRHIYSSKVSTLIEFETHSGAANGMIYLNMGIQGSNFKFVEI